MSAGFSTYVAALAVIAALTVAGWVASIAMRDVSIVDSLWSLFFLAAAIVFFSDAAPLGPRGMVVFTLVAAWSLRLAGYITLRNLGEGEDYRYGRIRQRHEPGFAFKSLYIVFGLQALLAWIIAAPLAPAISGRASLGPLDVAAIALWLIGFVFEAVGDHQLARFRRDPANRARVLDSGLWRYTRHPNYFGEFCIWWAFWLFALASGAWWTVFSPLLMSYLLLKVSGVAMLEKTIVDRRPGYADYVKRTNTFFPGRPAAGRSS